MREEELPALIDGCTAIGDILGLTPQGVRDMHRRGLVPIVKIGSSFFANRDALLECRRRGRYWSQSKRREEAAAKIAAEDATREAKMETA